jgi:chromosomal replication initiator protein
MDTAAQLEGRLREAVAERVGPAKFGVWFGESVRLGVDGDRLLVEAPNGFFRDWIAGHYTTELAAVAAAVTGRPLGVAVRVAAEAEPPLGNVVAPQVPGMDRPRGPSVPIPGAPGPAASPAPPTPSPRDRPRPGASASPRGVRRLEDFVVGPGNRLAHAAAVELVQSAGAAFNPLVIHGGVGLGKTHLMEGIAAGLRARMPGRTVLHLTAESFTNSFLDALRNGGLNGFRARYRHADALVLDDVHFLAAKRSTQDEFLHTFNALLNDGAPIVLAADQHPRLINRLPDELITRFLGGMVVKLEAPDPATRRAILRARAASRGVDVPDAVLGYIAEHLRSSVRELEGALNSLIAHAMLSGKRLDLNLARTALRDTIRHTAQAVALKDIERAVCALFQVDPEVLRSDSRARAVAHPRMMAMHLARKHTGASFSEIGRFFGGRNHSTVIAADKKVATWIRDEQRTGLLAGFESIGDVLASLERELGT